MERTPEATEDLVLVQLRDMRRENAVMREQQIRIVELLGRVSNDLGGLRSEIAGLRSEMAAMRAERAHVKSDVILLENQNMSRHGEVLLILRRLDPIERDFLARSDAAAEPPGK